MIVTLTSDFGTADSYVAQMKGVILALAPQVRIVDVTHDIPRHDIRAGAFVLAQAAPAFPAGTIHVAVVDPGVGGVRAPIVVEAGEHAFVGPNNGLLSLAAHGWRGAYRIDNHAFRRASVSATFEGRDVFAPAAARLASGTPAHQAGPPLDAIETLAWPEPHAHGGEVLSIDRFGNLVTNLRPEHVAGARGLRMGALEAPLLRTYSDVPPGAPLAYVGSAGFVEIGVREGSAAERAGAHAGAAVEVLR